MITYEEWVESGRPKDNPRKIKHCTYDKFVEWGKKHYGKDWIPPRQNMYRNNLRGFIRGDKE